jgi:hypothetical protein
VIQVLPKGDVGIAEAGWLIIYPCFCFQQSIHCALFSDTTPEYENLGFCQQLTPLHSLSQRPVVLCIVRFPDNKSSFDVKCRGKNNQKNKAKHRGTGKLLKFYLPPVTADFLRV